MRRTLPALLRTIVVVVVVSTSDASSMVDGDYNKLWVPGQTYPLDFHNEYCSQNCPSVSTSTSGMIDILSAPCAPCSCQDICELIGDCCPSYRILWAHNIFSVVVESFNLFPNPEEQGRQQIVPISEQENFFDFSFFECGQFCSHSGCRHFFVVSKCHDGEANVTLRNLCEAKPCETVRTCTPITHVKTGVTYKNYYCLMCNSLTRGEESTVVVGGERDNWKPQQPTEDVAGNTDFNNTGYVSWILEISCLHYQTLYSVTDEDELLRDARDIPDVCSVYVFLEASLNKTPSHCDPQFPMPRPDDSLTECVIDDPSLLYFCKYITHPAFRTSVGGQNLFCLLCRGFSLQKAGRAPDELTTQVPTTTSDPSHHDTDTQTVAPLSLLLGITNKIVSRAASRVVCSNSTWREDQDSECQQALCSLGKVATPSGLCASAVDQIRGLGYVVSVTLKPDKYISFTQSFSEVLRYWIYKTVASHALEIEMNIIATVYVNKSDSDNVPILKSVRHTSYIISNSSFQRDHIEQSIFKTANHTFVVRHGKKGRSTTSTLLSPVAIGHELHQMYMYTNSQSLLDEHDSLNSEMKRIFGKDTKFFSIEQFLYRPDYGAETAVLYPDIEVSGYEEEETVLLKVHPHVKVNRKQWAQKENFIDLTSTFVCPFMNLSVEESYVSWSGEMVFKVSHEDRTSNVTYNKDVMRLKEGVMYLCIDVFKKLFPPVAVPREKNVPKILQFYFEVFCFSLSTACLVLSLLTYGLFSSLRSLPGMNNIGLCYSLAVAQISLLVSAQHGGRGELPNIACAINAVLLHFSWLSAFAWMSVCTVHMFRVFKCTGTQFSQNLREDRRRYRTYLLSAHGLAAAVVILTVTTELIVSEGQSFGYSTQTCFLDTSKSILTFLLFLMAPLCAMILCNAILFVLTVWEIRSLTKLQEAHRARERTGLVTYVKLSTLTGGFWALAILAVQLDNVVLNFVTSSFIALQGVYIFLSFTANRHVRLLYKGLINTKKHPRAPLTVSTDKNGRNQRSKDVESSTEHTQRSTTVYTLST